MFTVLSKKVKGQPVLFSAFMLLLSLLFLILNKGLTQMSFNQNIINQIIIKVAISFLYSIGIFYFN